MASRDRAENRTDDRARSVPRRSAANAAADRLGAGDLAHDGGQIDRKGAFAGSMDSVSQPPTTMTHAPLSIRSATRADIPAIVECARSTSEEEEVGFGTPLSLRTFNDVERLSAVWRDPNVAYSDAGGEEVIVAETEGQVVGYVTVEERGEELELVNIDVRRTQQGRGIGSRLVQFVEQRAAGEGRRAVTLGTTRNAEGVAWKSLSWWQKLGYTVIGEEENAYTRAIGVGVREIRMRKPVGGAGA
jgi:ribosomal protein S18 acetylase RimI-like enzyme